MGKLLSLAIPSTYEYRLGVLVSVLQGVFAVSLLATSAWLISRAAEQPPVMYLMVAVVGVRGFALGRAAGRYAERMILHNATFRMLAVQRPRILEKLIPLAPAGLPDRGATISRLVSDVDELQNLPIRVAAPIIQSISISVLSVIGVALLLPSAALALAITLIGAFAIALPVSAWSSKAADELSAANKSTLASQNLQFLENIDVLKAFGWDEHALGEIRKTSDAATRIAQKTALSAGLGQGLISLFAIFATIAMAWIGATAVSEGKVAGVALAVFALLPMAIFEVVSSSQATISAWQRYRTSAGRVLEILTEEVPAEIRERAGQEVLRSVEKIEFADVAAKYPKAKPILSGLDFEINVGERVALVGPSGSGKTTIGNLLLGFLNPAAGEIRINDHPIQSFELASRRGLIGMVEQSPTIFAGSIRDNLILAKPDADDQELVMVLKRVGLWQMLSGRDGLWTEVGENGVMISGGEAQRLGLARALLADFQVLVLDEPTANVDAGMASNLVGDLFEAAGSKRTILLITHDPALAEYADRVITLA